MTQVEVLSPAGSMDSFRAAVNAGADAVYVGGSMFGARAYANNFDEEQLKDALDFAHIHGRKVYLTVNTLLKNSEIEEHLYDFLCPAYENGLDAVLVQDFGVFEFIRKNFPDIDIHASTQMTTNGVLSARLLQDKGAARIVTSRELSLEEIRAIRKETSLEIESFVHGALCYCYSGQCLMSSMIGGRSGNRGRCAQPCRLPYTVYDRNGNLLGRKEKHVLSPKDMCALELLPDIIDAGVFSLKIEGRMKSPEYTAGVVSIYKKYAELYLDKGREQYKVEPQDISSLMDLFNRGNFSNGYYFHRNGPEMMSMERPNHQGTKALEVIASGKGKMTVKALNELSPQDVVEVAPEFIWTNGQTRNKGVIFDINIPGNLKVKAGSVFYRIKNNLLLKTIDECWINSNIKEKVQIYGEFRLGERAYANISCNGYYYETYGNIIEQALNSPMDAGQIKKQLVKLGNTEFCADRADITADENIFVPVQELKELRRKLTAGLSQKMVLRRNAEIKKAGMQEELARDRSGSKEKQPCGLLDAVAAISVTVYDVELLNVVLEEQHVKRIYFEMSESSFSELAEIAERIKKAGKEAFLVLPYIFRKKTADIFQKNIVPLKNAGFGGYLIKNLDELQFLMDNEIKGKRILDYNVYRFNDYAGSFFKEMQVDRYTIPLELNKNEISSLDNSDSEMLVYGQLPVMVSAQCIMKNITGCTAHTDKAESVLYLKDRVGKYMPVVNQCAWCYNIIYNASPLNLLDQAEELKKCGISNIRLDLRFVKAEDAGQIIGKAVQAFIYDKETDVKGDFTRGHFLRGVE